jgi:hypothetical protein
MQTAASLYESMRFTYLVAAGGAAWPQLRCFFPIILLNSNKVTKK